MSKTDQIITIPSSPDTSISAPTSPVSSDTADESTVEERRQLIEEQIKQKKKKLKERARSCREKTLESELCRTIQRSVNSCLNDDNCRRATAIATIILAIIGLYHIIVAIL